MHDPRNSEKPRSACSAGAEAASISRNHGSFGTYSWERRPTAGPAAAIPAERLARLPAREIVVATDGSTSAAAGALGKYREGLRLDLKDAAEAVGCSTPRVTESSAAENLAAGPGQVTPYGCSLSPFASIATYFSIRRARVSTLFASWTRCRIE